MTAARYVFSDVPANPGSSLSRFALDTGPNGATVDPIELVATAYGSLFGQHLAETPILRPGHAELPLKQVTLFDGVYQLTDRGILRGNVTRQPIRQGKFNKLASGATGAALLDEFFTGGHAWQESRDHTVWDALLEACKAMRPDGENSDASTLPPRLHSPFALGSPPPRTICRARPPETRAQRGGAPRTPQIARPSSLPRRDQDW